MSAGSTRDTERGADRRRFPRLPCRVQVASRSRVIGSVLGRPWPALLCDASRTGFRLQTSRSVADGEELTVTLPDRPGLWAKPVPVRVVRIQHVRGQGYLLGCQLTRGELTESELRALVGTPSA